MIRRQFKYYLLLFLIPALTYSQKIQSISFEGISKFQKSDYLEWCRLSQGSNIFNGIQDSISARINRSLSERSFFHSKISTPQIAFTEDSSEAAISVFIDEGFQSFLSEISIDGLTGSDSALIAGNFKYLEGEPFNRSEIEFLILESLDIFENSGFPFASIKIASIYFQVDSVSERFDAHLYMKIDKGILSKIDRVEIVGNDKTSDNVIIRSIRLKMGELYSQRRIDEIPKRLNRLRFFEPVEPPKFYLNSKKEGVLRIQITEKETNNFDGIIGYAPASGKLKGYFTGKVNISLRNIFGSGRAAAFRWEQLERNSQELELKYLEPWIIGLPFNINIGLYQRKQDTTYVQRTFSGELEFMATEDISASLIVSTESTIPSIADSNKFTVFNSSLFSTGINFKFDTRDDVYAPTAGLFFLNTYTFNSKKINGPEKFITANLETELTIQKFEFDFHFYYELFDKQVAALKIHAREMTGSLLEVSDLYRLGGTNTIRGYRENQFLGNRLFWSNLEYRYLLTRRSYAFVFFDSGYFLKNEDKNHNIPKTSAVKLGYGIGLSIETGLGALAVSYALAKGASFSEGLIHFGIVNDF